ncbi:MAG: hypothetical protein LBV09_05880 [Deferribacteraceae bacterium]|jgi:signal transduction histidine kinase|nr:hypothetical protein [Deferribacteraceae bacterium]
MNKTHNIKKSDKHEGIAGSQTPFFYKKEVILELDLLNAVFDDIRIPLVVVNNALEILKVNSAASAMFGKDYLTLAELAPAIHPHVLSFKTAHKLSVRLPHIHVDKRCVDLQITQLSNDCIMVAIYDVTKEFSLSTQLRQAQKMETVGQLATGVAHDFANVLTVIGGFADIANKKLTEHPAAQYIEHIYNSAKKGNSMIRGLLAFSRRGESDHHITNVSLLVKSIVDMAGHMLRSDVHIVVNLFEGDLQVMADSVQIEQVILNLFTNAQDAMPKGGKIEVQTGVLQNEDSNDFVYIKVIDEGVGMDSRLIDQIFEPFFTTKPPHKGTGLGLAMVKEIVEHHSGKISCQSTVGVGTTFTIFLPVVMVTPWR